MRYILRSNLLIIIISILAIILMAVRRCRVIDMTDPDNTQEVVDIKSKIISR